MISGEPWRLGYRPALNGLRGMAVLLVLVAHFGVQRINGSNAGTVGVTVFFTLSGFLITALLLQERAVNGTVRRAAFYLRRLRRLGPALLCCLVLTVVLELATQGRITDGDLIIGGLTYTANVLMLDNHFGSPTFTGQLWSLSVEEQFYLVWPFLLAGLVRLPRLRLLLVLGYACGIGVLLRALIWHGPGDSTRVWVGTDTRSDGILIGCLLAVFLHGRAAQAASRWWAVGGGVVLVLLLPARLNADPWSTAVTAPLLAALATAAIIFTTVNRPPGVVLGSRLLRYVGARSYGIYLYHVSIVTALHIVAGESMTAAWLIALPATLLAAELSWRFVEQPVMRRGSAQAGDGHGAVGGVEGAGAAADLEVRTGHVVAGRQVDVH